jgi:hypothetical protein
MTPPELLLASLGSCAAFYAVQYLKSRNLAESGVEVSVTADKLKQPTRIGNFRILVKCPISLTEDQKEGLMRSVHHCLVHNTLLVLQLQMAVAEGVGGFNPLKTGPNLGAFRPGSKPSEQIQL